MKIPKTSFEGNFNLKSLLPERVVETCYISAGAALGDAISYGLDIFPGDGRQLNSLLRRLVRWEAEYARRGFRTIKLDRFVDFGGYGESLDNILGQKREEGEEPILYARMYLVSLSKN